MDPFRLCVVMAPLAAYMTLLAVVNFARRPVVISGATDLAALGLGVVGLLVVGPIELLFPRIPSELTAYVWLIVLLIYCLVLNLFALLGKPRLVVYNVTLDQLRPVLSEVVNDLDADARWAGSSVALPKLNVELYLDDHPAMRNVSLVATSSPQSYTGWRTLDKALRAQLRARVESAPNLCAVASLVVALCMAGSMAWLAYFHGRDIAQGFADMMRF
jgi:hypothetical protein